MNAKKRYGFLLASIILLAILYNGVKWTLHDLSPKSVEIDRRQTVHNSASQEKNSVLSKRMLRSLSSVVEEYYDTLEDDTSNSPSEKQETRKHVYKHRKCRMETCFDAERCHKKGFKIYVYPDTGDKISQNYRSILSALRLSIYFTNNPEQACLFVVPYDTLDRDKISQNYVHNIGAKVSALKYWNNGRNHIIFTLFSGTWPDYLEDVGFDTGEAILAKASFSDNYYRPGFDVSLPLFGKNHFSMHGPSGTMKSNYFPPRRKYLLTFKGKRYTYGIGSSTRNALYHIHNGEDIIMLTTCKHGKQWESFSDAKCAADNEEYDKWDYQALLHNSTFCMTPRGRRLGSFRFLESLQTACVPVVLANGWMLPFAEVLDWPKASLVWDERLLLQVPNTLRDICDETIMEYRQQSQFLWNTYFSSVENMVQTTLEIIRDRVFPAEARPSFVWNTPPGALFYLPSYSGGYSESPFYYSLLGTEPPRKFTAVIQATSPVTSSAAPIVKLIKSLLQTVACGQIIIIWHSGSSPPPSSRWKVLSMQREEIPIEVIEDSPKVIGRRFFPFQNIRYHSVLSLDDDTMLNIQEIDFAFEVWRNFPDRIVGFPARSHFWDVAKKRWVYTSKWSNSYSMVLTGAAFVHRYYFNLYSEWLPASTRAIVDDLSNCEDILMNMLVSHVTGRPPIKVTQKKHYKDTSQQGQAKPAPGGVVSMWSDPQHFADRQTCMQKFVEFFGYMPLVSSSTRMDPAFFKDNVSIKRKRYPKIEI
uniref:Exostosin-1-like n=1 Tax=Phallusia mammillata TaxID=59560 RepID=A0A6F9DBL6_9ASCI|nr:exostosin-1-like [Phallusia mammillata]